MSLWERLWYAPVAALRPYLLSKLVLILLAFDAWLLMIGHAARYGAGGFNVAHFAWLDAVQPVPTPGLYVGVLLLTGMLALVVALSGAGWWLRLPLFLLYTYSWAMSMLDSYQHHYFLSIVLFCLIFVPSVDARKLWPPPADLAPAAGKKRRQRAERRAHRHRVATSILAAGLLCSLLGLRLADASWLVWLAWAGLAAAACAIYLQRHEAPVPEASVWGYRMLGVSIAIMYAFAAVAKMEEGWLAGHTLRRISTAEELLTPLQRSLHPLGLAQDSFWSLVAGGAIALELGLALGYLVALHQDAIRTRATRAIGVGSWLLAMNLHVGAEAMDLRIGWFSDYMILLGCVFLLPARGLVALGSAVTWPARGLVEVMERWDREERGNAVVGVGVLALATGGLVWLIGTRVDLPGSSAAGFIAGLTLVIGVGIGCLRGMPQHARRYVLATGVAASVMWITIATSDVRWDFYRYWGGDLMRRNQPRRALQVYRKAERYAPEGESRQHKIDELRQRLGVPR